MSLTGEAGAQHYSDEELRAIVDEAHRRGLRVAAHTHGAEAVKHAVECGIDCIEHGFLMDDEAIKMLVDNDRFLVTTRRLAEAMDVSRAPKELQDKAAEMFPKARTSIKAAYEAGVKIAVGTDAPAIPHGRNADELVTLVDWGMPADGGAARRDRRRRGSDQQARSRPDRRGLPGGHHRGAGRSPVRYQRYTERQLCNEGR